MHMATDFADSVVCQKAEEFFHTIILAQDER